MGKPLVTPWNSRERDIPQLEESMGASSRMHPMHEAGQVMRSISEEMSLANLLRDESSQPRAMPGRAYMRDSL